MRSPLRPADAVRRKFDSKFRRFVAQQVRAACKTGQKRRPDDEFRAKAAAKGGFDLIIDCTGVPKVIEQAVPLMADEGRLLFFGVCPQDAGISVNPYEIYQRELTFIGSNSLKKTFYSAMLELKSGRVKVSKMIGDKILLDELPRQIQAFAEKKTKLKTVVYPNGFVG